MNLTFYPWTIIIVFRCPDAMSSIYNWRNLILLHFGCSFTCNSINGRLKFAFYEMSLNFKLLRLSLSRLPHVPTVNYQFLCFEFAIFQFLSLLRIQRAASEDVPKYFVRRNQNLRNQNVEMINFMIFNCAVQ